MNSPSELTDFLTRLDQKRLRLAALAASDEASAVAHLADEVAELGEQLLVADEELRAQHDQLAESRTRLEALAARDEELFGAAADALLITDDHGIVLNSNIAADRLLGRPVLGKPIAGRFGSEHRRAVRTLITRSRISDDVQQLQTGLPGGDEVPEAVEVELRVFTDPLTGRRRLRWRFTPEAVPPPPTVLSLVRPVAALTAEQLFAGPGETSALLRGTDWAAGPLGPVADWPAELVAAVRTVLSSPVPMAIWWGPRLVQLYNDAFAPVLQGEHPGALGRPAADCWAGSWSRLGPLADTVWTAAGTGRVEHAGRTLSAGPIRDGGDGVAGVLVVGGEQAPTADLARVDTAAEAGRILLVDADADMRGYLTELLTREGWQVRAVAGVDEALAGADRPDLVLSDVLLPGRSGVELVTLLRSQPALERIPCILLTAQSGSAAVLEGLRAGADDYIVKPFDPAELLARVRTHLELTRLREAALHDAQDRAEHLTRALSSNRRIGMAIGILMHQLRLTEDQAFEKLRKSSQNQHRKLREVAEEVARAGTALPTD